jgi:hypothetical protein
VARPRRHVPARRVRRGQVQFEVDDPAFGWEIALTIVFLLLLIDLVIGH